MNLEGGQQFDLSGLSSHHHTEIGDTPENEVSKQKWSRIANSIPPHLSFFDQELTERVYQLYRSDFEDYGYPKELPAH